ncbi:hypothetical protein GCM10017764_32550 [Sphingobacterium griseoflavum]|uniref:Uncharacterized protein n=1 Tax=Sphingobacterium griseoflavum TaxID=1474952 RepID=A0ABQ3I200_9SPHI|nr:hypothetical protein GCM10017764_32550 [Sphingobacterium griseoflavum]
MVRLTKIKPPNNEIERNKQNTLNNEGLPRKQSNVKRWGGSYRALSIYYKILSATSIYVDDPNT